MVESKKEQKLHTRPPNPQEERWFDYVDNLPFLSDEYLTKFADKMLGLNTAMIAAYIAGIKLVSSTVKFYYWIPIGLLVTSLLLSLISIRPKQKTRKYRKLQHVQTNYEKGIDTRRKQTAWSFILYFFGILSGIFIIMLG